MREIYSEIIINSSAEMVWKKLTDFSSYPSWNPLIRIDQGEPRRGALLQVRISPPGSFVMTLRPRVKRVENNREFRWVGSFLIPGIFDGEHCFRIIDKEDNKVLFQHFERFSGLLVPIVLKSIEANIRRGFEEMNIALKDSVEGAL